MSLVVFMRGVNVGGHRTFQPAALARELAALDVVNVAAAGTFVVRKSISQGTLRAELLRRLPFQPQLVICRSSEIIDLANGEPFPREASRGDVRRFVSIMAKRPRPLPPLPITHPAGLKALDELCDRPSRPRLRQTPLRNRRRHPPEVDAGIGVVVGIRDDHPQLVRDCHERKE
jgi:hypothetical protein